MALGISEAVELTGKIADLLKKGITIDLQERVLELREAVLNAKDEVLTLRDENAKLREQLREKTKSEERAALYKFVKTPAGAMVYHTDGPPEHYACPNCWERPAVSVLQPAYNGAFRCPSCEKGFQIRSGSRATVIR